MRAVAIIAGIGMMLNGCGGNSEPGSAVTQQPLSVLVLSSDQVRVGGQLIETDKLTDELERLLTKNPGMVCIGPEGDVSPEVLSPVFAIVGASSAAGICMATEES